MSQLMRRLSFSRSKRESSRESINLTPSDFEAWLSKRSMSKASAFKKYAQRYIILSTDGVLSWHKEPGTAASGSMQIGPGATIAFDDKERLRISSGNTEVLLKGKEELLTALECGAAQSRATDAARHEQWLTERQRRECGTGTAAAASCNRQRHGDRLGGGRGTQLCSRDVPYREGARRRPGARKRRASLPRSSRGSPCERVESGPGRAGCAAVRRWRGRGPEGGGGTRRGGGVACGGSRARGCVFVQGRGVSAGGGREGGGGCQGHTGASQQRAPSWHSRRAKRSSFSRSSARPKAQLEKKESQLSALEKRVEAAERKAKEAEAKVEEAKTQQAKAVKAAEERAAAAERRLPEKAA